MKIYELFEQIGTVGSSGSLTGGSTIPTTSGSASAGSTTDPSVSGNVQSLTDPSLQAALLAKQKQQKEQQKKDLKDKIAQMEKELADQKKQLSSLDTGAATGTFAS